MTRVALVVLACAACGGHSGDDVDAAGPPGVSLTATTTYASAAGSTTMPTDLSTTTFYVLQGYSYTRYPRSGTVTGGADGTAQIPGVPDGPYILVVNGNEFQPQTSHAVTWSTTYYGRAGAAIGGAGTTLELAVDGMQPWGNADWYAVAASANGALLGPYNASDQTTALPAAGATAFDETFPWSLTTAASPRPTLIEAGDTVTLAHYTGSITDDGSTVQLLAEAATLAPPTPQVSGDATVLAGSFAPLAATEPIEFRVDSDAVIAALPPHLATAFDHWRCAVTGGPLAALGEPQGLAPISFTGADPVGVHVSGTQHMPAIDTPLVSTEVDLFGVYAVPGANAWSYTGDTYWQAAYTPGAAPIDLPATVPMATGATVLGTSAIEQFVTWDERAPVSIAIDAPAGTQHNVNVSRIDGGATQVIAFLELGDATSISLPAYLFSPGAYYMLEVNVSSSTSATDQQGSWLPYGKFRIGAANKSFCGDGVVDAALGETCDDGGGGSCSATCQ